MQTQRGDAALEGPMRLPASVLGSLRVGLGATALIAGGCDAEEAAPVQEVVAQAARVEAVVTEPGLAAEVTSIVEDAAAEVAEPAAAVSEELVAVAEPVAVELSEEVTAFVPFSEEPENAEPIRPRIRPRVRPRPRRHVETKPAKEWPWGSSSPKWNGDSCPACGRG